MDICVNRWVLIHYSHYLFYCSNCPTCNHWEIFLVCSRVLSKCPHHFWSISILFVITRYSRLLFCFPHPRNGVSYFFMEPLFFFIGGWCLEIKIWKLNLILLSMITSSFCQFTELGNICILTCTYIHTLLF